MTRRSDALMELALQAHQITSTADPTRSVRALVRADDKRRARRTVAAHPERFIGRPYFVWKDDPEIARSINDRLAGAT